MNALVSLSVLGVIALISGLFSLRKMVIPISVIGLIAVIGLSVTDWDSSLRWYNDMIFVNNYSIVFTSLMSFTTLLIVLLYSAQTDSLDVPMAETIALFIFALTGAMVMVSFSNLAMLFLGIEIMSISVYILAGSRKRDFFSNEAALKYFLMGAFATGIVLFGIALIYGVTGSFHLIGIKQYVINNINTLPPIFYAGILLLMVGMAFKISAVPFHFWAPDVYQGAPTAVTAFMATVVKTAGIAALYRLFSEAFGDIVGYWAKTLMIISALTMTLGNISALVQTSVKRTLAYSSIGHAGYFLLAIFSMGNNAANALLLYAAAYSLASVVVFLGVILVEEQTKEDSFEGFNGLAKRNPLLAFGIAVALFSMAGIPPAAGFLAKFSVFSAAISKNYIWMVILAVVNSCIGIFYYFRIIKAMYMAENASEEKLSLSSTQNIVVILTCVLTLLLGIAPGLILNLI
jgi:NADH-quinone oxidoreductase subunit N